MFRHIFGIAEYWGTQGMYSSDHVFCDLYIYIYMHVDAHFLAICLICTHVDALYDMFYVDTARGCK